MSELEPVLALGALLFVKHFVADGPLQTSYQVQNKGVLLHPAGLAHAGTHAGLTFIVLAVWAEIASAPEFSILGPSLGAVAIVCLVEFAVHYAIDYSKCALESRFRWASADYLENGKKVLRIEDERFFYAFLADQTCHSLTYIAILYWVALSLGAA